MCVENALGKINRILERSGRRAFLHRSKKRYKLVDVNGSDSHHKICLNLFRSHVESRLGHVLELFGRAEIPQGGLDTLLLLVEVPQEKGDEAIQREMKLETKRPLFLRFPLLARLI